MTGPDLLHTVRGLHDHLANLNELVSTNPDDGLVPVIVFVTGEQYASIQRLGMDLTAVMQNWLDDDIECYETIAEEQKGTPAGAEVR